MFCCMVTTISLLIIWPLLLNQHTEQLSDSYPVLSPLKEKLFRTPGLWWTERGGRAAVCESQSGCLSLVCASICVAQLWVWEKEQKQATETRQEARETETKKDPQTKTEWRAGKGGCAVPQRFRLTSTAALLVEQSGKHWPLLSNKHKFSLQA